MIMMIHVTLHYVNTTIHLLLPYSVIHLVLPYTMINLIRLKVKGHHLILPYMNAIQPYANTIQLRLPYVNKLIHLIRCYINSVIHLVLPYTMINLIRLKVKGHHLILPYVNAIQPYANTIQLLLPYVNKLIHLICRYINSVIHLVLPYTMINLTRLKVKGHHLILPYVNVIQPYANTIQLLLPYVNKLIHLIRRYINSVIHLVLPYTMINLVRLKVIDHHKYHTQFQFHLWNNRLTHFVAISTKMLFSPIKFC